MEIGGLLYIVIIILLLNVILQTFGINITQLIGILVNRRPKFKDNDPDILIRLKNLYSKAGKHQTGTYKTVKFTGDKYTPEIGPFKLTGIIHDHRSLMVLFKPKMLSRKQWMPIPRQMISSSLGKTLIIKCNGWRPYAFGIFVLPVLRLEDSDKEEKYYSQCRDLIKNILGKEQEALTLERAVHNAVVAPGMDEITQSQLMQEDFRNNGSEAVTSE